MQIDGDDRGAEDCGPGHGRASGEGLWGHHGEDEAGGVHRIEIHDPGQGGRGQ